jgi:hypothetical protein
MKRPVPREVPASAGQRLLWLMEHYRGGAGTLNSPALCRLTGRLDVTALRAALTQLAQRHEALRTTFSGTGHRLVQVVHEPRPVTVAEVDLRAPADAPAALNRLLVDELRTRVEAETWPVRVTLYRVGDFDHVLCVNIHHFMTDGWSTGIIIRDLALLYHRIAAGAAVELPAAGWPYARFVTFQQELMASPAWHEHREYWCRQLAGVRFCEFPAPGRRVEPARRHTEIEPFEVADDVVSALNAVARAERVTIFPVMLAVFYALVRVRTGDLDLAVASLFANRSRAEVRNTVGFFANMVVLRAVLREHASFRDVVRVARATVVQAMTHQAMPYQMVPLTTVGSSPSRAEDLMFQMLPGPLHSSRAAETEIRQMLPPDGLASRFDMEFVLIARRGGGLDGMALYAADRFDRSWVRDLTRGYLDLAAALARDPDAVIKPVD